MPNICSCMMECDGASQDVEALLRFLCPNPNEDTFDFNKVIPAPDGLESDIPEGLDYEIAESISHLACGFTSLYDFHVTQWGTKWNADNVFVNRTSGTFFFDTAWCPPCGVYVALSKMFPNISFVASAFEGGCGICETITYKDGAVVDECYPEYQSKEWYELMFEVEGGEDLYEFDESTGTYKEKE